MRYCGSFTSGSNSRLVLAAIVKPVRATIGNDGDKSRYLDDRSGNIAFGRSRALHVVAGGSGYCWPVEIDHPAAAKAKKLPLKRFKKPFTFLIDGLSLV